MPLLFCYYTIRSDIIVLYRDVIIMKSFADWYKSSASHPPLFDGGFGSLLIARGLPPDTPSALWNLERPGEIEAIHRAYLSAGADVVTSNTFTANPWFMGNAAGEAARVGVAIARKAVKAAGHGIVALDIGPTGRMMEPYGDLSFDEAVEGYERVIRAALREKPDVVLLETFTDAYEVKAAVAAARCAKLPVLVSCSFGESGRLLSGETPAALVPLLESMGVAAVGVNCGAGPSGMLGVVEQMAKLASVPVFANPNAGLPELVDGTEIFRLAPDEFASRSVELFRAGARMLGGCCGTTPDHIAALRTALDGMTSGPLTERRGCSVTGGPAVRTFGKQPLWIADRILHGKDGDRLSAIARRDWELMIDECQDVADRGADMINVDLSGTDANEAELFAEFIPQLQMSVKLPLAIDTRDPAALEAALRAYHGKPLINACDCTQACMDAVFPLAVKYGGAVIIKLRDEEGIPKTPELRVKLAHAVAAKARAVGLAKRNVIFDPIVMPVRTHMNALYSAIQSTKLIHDKLGYRVVLGVSNYSRGKTDRPRRDVLLISHAMDAKADAMMVNIRSDIIATAVRTADD